MVVIGGPPGKSGSVDCPPPGFDPKTASAEDLLAYNLPLRPDPDFFPELHDFWDKMFSAPLNFLPCILKGPDGSSRETSDNRQRQSSLNWSGASIKPRDGKIFTEIHGSWCVPEIKASQPPAVSVPGRPEGCSIWIGFDGQRRYYQSSLPQIGTLQSLKKDDAPTPDPTHSAWFQWWDREGDKQGRADSPWTIEGFPVAPGDHIMCSLFRTDPAHVTFIIKNVMTGDIVVSYDIAAPIRDIPLTISGATAEWITERPSVWPSPEDRYDFPNYGRVEFDDCIAVMTEPGGGSREQRDLIGARLIGMREVRQNPTRTAKISIKHTREISKTQAEKTHAFQIIYQASAL